MDYIERDIERVVQNLDAAIADVRRSNGLPAIKAAAIMRGAVSS